MEIDELKAQIATLTTSFENEKLKQQQISADLAANEKTSSEVERLRLQLTEIKEDFQEALEEEESKRAQAELEVKKLQNAMQGTPVSVNVVHARRAAPPPPSISTSRRQLAHQQASPSEEDLMHPSYKPKTLEEAKARRERLRAARAHAR